MNVEKFKEAKMKGEMKVDCITTMNATGAECHSACEMDEHEQPKKIKNHAQMRLL